jgi:3,4-dihydroxy 2-butanone 4-phosphate synthase/GTP cyclohydrolase II
MISAMAVSKTGQGGSETGVRAAAALAALAAGGSIMLLDEARGRGYFACAADRGGEELIAHATEHGRGVLKVAMTPAHLQQLAIPVLIGADCHAPVDLTGCERPGVAADRIATLRALVDPALDGDRLVTPGHVFPTAAGDCHTIDDACVSRVLIEAARLAGCAPVAAFCEAVDERAPAGTPARPARLAALARRLGLESVSVREVMIHRELVEPAVDRVVETALPTAQGPLAAVGYVGRRSEQEYVAFLAGTEAAAVRVHIHRRCQVSDVFGGVRCGCGEHLREALDEVHSAGDGMLVYYGSETEGFCAADEGTGPATWAFTAEIAAMLRDLGVHRAVVSSNGPLSPVDLAALGVDVTLRARSETCAA